MRVGNPHVVPLLTCMLSYFSYVLIQVSVCASYKQRLFTRAWRILDKLRIFTHAQKLDKLCILCTLEQATIQLGPCTVLKGPLILFLVRDLNSGPRLVLLLRYNAFAIVGTSRYLQWQKHCIFIKVQVKVRGSNPWWGTRSRDLVVPYKFHAIR